MRSLYCYSLIITAILPFLFIATTYADNTGQPPPCTRVSVDNQGGEGELDITLNNGNVTTCINQSHGQVGGTQVKTGESDPTHIYETNHYYVVKGSGNSITISPSYEGFAGSVTYTYEQLGGGDWVKIICCGDCNPCRIDN